MKIRMNVHLKMLLVICFGHMWEPVHIMCKNLFFAEDFCGHMSLMELFCNVFDAILLGISS